MNKLKVGYFADGPWSHLAFEEIIKKEHIEIQFIVPRYDTKDDTLKNYCSYYNIPYLIINNINSQECYELVLKYDCDLFVSMSFNQIFKERIINLPKLKTINCHAGKLPFYRGRNILNWVLINDEKEFGITVHFVDEGIDTGDIIHQKTFPIDDSDSYATLLQRAYQGCSNVLVEAIDMLANNNYTLRQQSTIHPVGFYCGMRGHGDELINWSQSSRHIFNFIRAICKPGPMATTSLNGKTLRIDKAAMVKYAPEYLGIAGQIVGKTSRGYLVKTQDTVIEIFDVHFEDRIKIGDRLK